MIAGKDSNNVITIDCNYIYPQFACSYLVTEGEKTAFIENNTRFAVPALISALKDLGLKTENVEYIIVTHVHLDHSGGTAALAKECPNATVIAHDRAARHIIDPEKLIKGSITVYGEEKFNRLYGKIDPVEEKRVRIVKDGEKLKFGNRKFEFIYTLGHAKHHMCVYDSSINGIFTGDSFGLAYPAHQTGKSLFVFPSTTPSDFDAEESRKSVKKILATGASTVYLTHFGPLTKIKEASDMLMNFFNDIEKIQNEALNQKLEGGALDKFCLEKMTECFYSVVKKLDMKFTPESEGTLKTDIILNAQGVAVAVRKITAV